MTSPYTLDSHICLIVKARKGSTPQAVVFGKALIRTWMGFTSLAEAQQYKPKNGAVVVAIVPLQLDLEKL